MPNNPVNTMIFRKALRGNPPLNNQMFLWNLVLKYFAPKLKSQRSLRDILKHFFCALSKYLLQSASQSSQTLNMIRIESDRSSSKLWILNQQQHIFIFFMWHRLLLTARMNQQQQTGQMGFKSVRVYGSFFIFIPFFICKKKREKSSKNIHVFILKLIVAGFKKR